MHNYIVEYKLNFSELATFKIFIYFKYTTLNLGKIVNFNK